MKKNTNPTERGEIESVPFTSYDLGWLVLCVGMAIGSAIIFLPIQVGIKGLWVFFGALVIAYPAVYLIQAAFLKSLSKTESCTSYSDVIGQYMNANWALVFSVLYCLNMFKNILQYSMSVTYDSAYYIYSFGMAEKLLSDSFLYGFFILFFLTMIAMRGEKLLFKVSGPMVVVKFLLIISLAIFMFPYWKASNIIPFPTIGKFIVDVVLTLPFALFSIDFFPSLSPMNVAFRKKYNDSLIATYRALRVNRIAYCILVAVVFIFTLSFTLSLTHDEAIDAWEKNISFLAISAKLFPGESIKIISVVLNVFAMVTAFFGIYLAFHEGIKGIINNILKRYCLISKIRDRTISHSISVFIIILLSIWVKTGFSILLISQLSAPIYAILACFLPVYFIVRVKELNYLKSWKAIYIVFIGIMLCLTPVFKFIE